MRQIKNYHIKIRQDIRTEGKEAKNRNKSQRLTCFHAQKSHKTNKLEAII